MLKLRELSPQFLRREDGQTMAEYGVVLTVIVVGISTALLLLSGNIEDVITRVAGYVS